MPRYVVVGPQMTEKVDIGLDDGTGPIEDYRDVFLVDAPNRNTARWASYKEALRRGSNWKDVSDHPLTSVVVTIAKGEDANLQNWKDFYIDASNTTS